MTDQQTNKMTLEEKADLLNRLCQFDSESLEIVTSTISDLIAKRKADQKE